MNREDLCTFSHIRTSVSRCGPVWLLLLLLAGRGTGTGGEVYLGRP